MSQTHLIPDEYWEKKPQTMNDIIFKSNTPWDNPYQGRDMKVLFVCSAGILRSATAARIYAQRYNTRSAGSHEYALIPVTGDLLLWADRVVFVNEENYRKTCQQFDLDSFHCNVTVLNIPDQYEHMHPDLIKHFEAQFEPINGD